MNPYRCIDEAERRGRMTNISIDYSNLDTPLPYGRFLLYQTGRRILAVGESVAEHTHRDFFELTRALGRGRCKYQRKNGTRSAW